MDSARQACLRVAQEYHEGVARVLAVIPGESGLRPATERPGELQFPCWHGH